jgi:hypothetical protein
MRGANGKLRRTPDECEVGDWITAESRPEWDGDAPGGRVYRPNGREGEAMVFRLEPYVDGKRVVVWRRVG